MREAVIISAVRTPIGRYQGGLRTLTAPQLGAQAIEGALARTTLHPDLVGEVIMGCVLQSGLGQNPARQAALKASLPVRVSALTVNMVCGSGLRSVMLAAQSIICGSSTFRYIVDQSLLGAGGDRVCWRDSLGTHGHRRFSGWIICSRQSGDDRFPERSLSL